MLRRFLLSAVLLLVATPAMAAACDLSIVVSCQGGSCTATTVNNGTGSCTGLVYSGWWTQTPHTRVQLSAPQTSFPLDDCMDSTEFGQFIEMAFAFCFGDGSIGPGQTLTSTVQITGQLDQPLAAITWVGDESGVEAGSAFAFVNAETPTCTPSISAPPLTQSGLGYTVTWSAVSDPTAQYIIEESGSPDFSSNVTQTQVQGLSKTFLHDGMATTTTYYYRVRATHCAGGTPAFSRVAQTVVQAVPPPANESAEVAVPFGSTQPVSFQVHIPGSLGSHGANALAHDPAFTATTDKPYLTVTPSTGALPPQGVNITVTANPTALPPGANTGTLQVTANGATANIPVSISLVTPVMPGSKSTPPANALIIPVVTHVNGASFPFLSDVRLTNSGGTAINYQITMTPTQTDGRTSSKVTQITVDGQSTVALNDIVKNFFGFGATNNPSDVGFGSLEIRPLSTSSTATFASSRTYAATLAGTFGQYIAAMPFTKFATLRTGAGLPIPGGPAPVSPKLSLQHVAQSVKFRTNLGIVEGAGESASGVIRIFSALGTLLKEVPFALQPGEHKQMNGFISNPAFGGLASLEDGRIEIEVQSPTGAVTAYASVLDNVTTDPLAVMPVDATKVSANRYVIPGMAELPDRIDNFHSDLRLFNGGTSDVPVTLTFYPMGGGTPVPSQPRTVRAGEVLVLDNILPTLFNASNTGGSVIVTTPASSSLVATGRTYTSVADGGTFGQFIPGVTPSEGVGAGERALQVMQLEESSGFRSNLGLAELTGNPVTVRISLHLPDTKTTASTELTLGPNEFRQLRPILGLNPGKQTYNARISVQVIGGTGRVTAYGSVIDNESKDPTYVPALPPPNFLRPFRDPRHMTSLNRHLDCWLSPLNGDPRTLTHPSQERLRLRARAAPRARGR